tara:strand:- start:142 stop:1872 length:1731 start_codon:yes stop_codon:yes gene_type:complete
MGVLSTLVIAIAGNLPAEPNNIKKWVEANGGKWATRVDANVTHLIASKEAWNKVTNPIMKAAELNIHIVSYDWLEDSLQGRRKLAEKKYKWEMIKKDKKRKRQLKKLGVRADGKKFIEGCKETRELTGSGTSVKLPPERKPKKSTSFFFGEQLNTPFVTSKDDLLRRREAREAKETAEKVAKAAKAVKKSGSAEVPIEIEDGTPDPDSSAPLPTPPTSVSPARSISKTASPAPSKPAVNAPSSAEPQAKKLSLKDRYHYYLDSTGFEYKIVLARINPTLNNITRYQLSILESHTTPHTYCTFVQYAPPGGAPDPTPTKSELSYASMRNPLLNFLKHANQPNSTAATNATTPTDPQAEASRLRSLITPTTPSSTQPYKTLICPMDSDFSSAWRAFRHAFRDTTLLSWEERFDSNKAVQKARAKALNIEPYTYARPAQGMPVGLRVQEAGLYQGSGDVVVVGDADDGYVRNEFALPGVDEPLGKGLVGAAIWRDEEAKRVVEEADERRKEKREGMEKEKRREEKKKKARVNYNKPMFNCATGRPETDACGKATAGGVSKGGYSGAVKKVKPFWGYERE